MKDNKVLVRQWVEKFRGVRNPLYLKAFYHSSSLRNEVAALVEVLLSTQGHLIQRI